MSNLKDKARVQSAEFNTTIRMQYYADTSKPVEYYIKRRSDQSYVGGPMTMEEYVKKYSGELLDYTLEPVDD